MRQRRGRNGPPMRGVLSARWRRAARQAQRCVQLLGRSSHTQRVPSCCCQPPPPLDPCPAIVATCKSAPCSPCRAAAGLSVVAVSGSGSGVHRAAAWGPLAAAAAAAPPRHWRRCPLPAQAPRSPRRGPMQSNLKSALTVAAICGLVAAFAYPVVIVRSCFLAALQPPVPLPPPARLSSPCLRCACPARRCPCRTGPRGRPPPAASPRVRLPGALRAAAVAAAAALPARGSCACFKTRTSTNLIHSFCCALQAPCGSRSTPPPRPSRTSSS